MQLYGSGASALAAALMAVVVSKQVVEPEVILPAYTCPELVSAILFAGARPVLVDLEPRRPWLGLADLAHKITGKTVAVIAVSLFGIPERFDAIRGVINGRDIVLVEDSAQYFPVSRDSMTWRGDMTILSFGRGKPVSLLGGGLVLCDDAALYRLLPSAGVGRQGVSVVGGGAFRLKARLYNLLLSPWVYWLPAALPFLHLGETKYTAMASISPFNSAKAAYMGVNVDAYWRNGQAAQTALSDMLDALRSNRILDLPRACDVDGSSRLVRYPVLAGSREQRDAWYARLDREGLGVSRLYQRPLSEMEGLEDLCGRQGAFPHAKDFADTLLTLPVHHHVGKRHVQAIKNILSEELP